ncbi:hypothetical protein RBE51_21175 [Pseudomonas taiwanensis]|uniref:hypothetical protein n=1 Tax=Pseudomonas taiwanensis TaxID=470150 RepID=UPI0028DFB099|nr:hypothetical protein [Pseudomonas taiwanensis]MDT8925310.1 hypothetical protein [Pseudomonas taiwanensis]
MSQASDQVFPAQRIVILDEGWRLWGDNQQLERALLSLPSVPNARYLVRGEQVFVFKRLLQQVQEQAIDPATAPEAVMALVATSWVDPAIAVSDYQIVPVGYAIERSEGGFCLQHDALEARVPALFLSHREAQRALADILVGRSIACAGDFQYEGQWLQFNAPLTLDLPAKPSLAVDACHKECPSDFSPAGFEPGLSPFDQAFYSAVATLIGDWEAERRALMSLPDPDLPDVWAMLATRELPKPDFTTDLEAQENTEENAEALKLMSIYPELAHLSKQQVYGHFYGFMSDRLHQLDVEAVRDEDFALYLLGTQVHPVQNEDLSVARGAYAWFALKQACTWGQACEFAMGCEAYGEALSTLRGRVSSAMRVLYNKRTRQEELAQLQPPLSGVTAIGSPMDTFDRMLRVGRKYWVGTCTSGQSWPQEAADMPKAPRPDVPIEIGAGGLCLNVGSHTYDFVPLASGAQAVQRGSDDGQSDT